MIRVVFKIRCYQHVDDDSLPFHITCLKLNRDNLFYGPASTSEATASHKAVSDHREDIPVVSGDMEPFLSIVADPGLHSDVA